MPCAPLHGRSSSLAKCPVLASHCIPLGGRSVVGATLGGQCHHPQTVCNGAWRCRFVPRDVVLVHFTTLKRSTYRRRGGSWQIIHRRWSKQIVVNGTKSRYVVCGRAPKCLILQGIRARRLPKQYSLAPTLLESGITPIRLVICFHLQKLHATSY